MRTLISLARPSSRQIATVPLMIVGEANPADWAGTYIATVINRCSPRKADRSLFCIRQLGQHYGLTG